MDLDQLKRYKIGVLAGGPSSEREVSLKSGMAVFKAFKEQDLDVHLIDISRAVSIRELKADAIDVVFIALHGRYGEDGQVQSELVKAGIPYTGSGPLASAIAMDKIRSKERFVDAGLNTPYHVRAVKGVEIDLLSLGLPCVVKPSLEGSSVGLTVVREAESLVPALEKAFDHGDDIIVERFIPGRELTVGILGSGALPVVEILPSGGIYDFHAKYHASDTVYRVPADLPDGLSMKVREVGVKAHHALGCEGFSRVDLRMDMDGDLYVLEVNTIPGLTERSLLPMAAGAAGIGFKDLCCEMLSLAFSRT